MIDAMRYQYTVKQAIEVYPGETLVWEVYVTDDGGDTWHWYNDYNDRQVASWSGQAVLADMESGEWSPGY